MRELRLALLVKAEQDDDGFQVGKIALFFHVYSNAH